MPDTDDVDDEESREKFGIHGGAEAVDRVREAVRDDDE